jgi:chemotaxis protein methyltransferase CheR
LGDRREFEFTAKHFQWFVTLVMDKTGITLSDKKEDLVYGRLARRLRKLNFNGFDQYQDYLLANPEDEMVEFINSITTNLTSFYREAHHFEFLGGTLLKKLLHDRRDEKRIRIWSAGCSTGEEPYTIAMTLCESIPNIDSWDVKILATDIDTNVLARASEGIYKKDKINGIGEARLKKWFLKPKDSANFTEVRVSPKIRNLITFKELNLMEAWPMKGPFDILFCRNVVIYFNKDTQRILFERFANILKDDAHMFLGHSESLFKVTDRFTLLGKTIHQKAA